MAPRTSPAHHFAPLTPSSLTAPHYVLYPPPTFPSFTLVLTQKSNNDVLVIPWTPIEYIQPQPRLLAVQESPRPVTRPVAPLPTPTRTNPFTSLLKFIRRCIANLVDKVKTPLSVPQP
ncbi:hypothetical protein MIND_00439100 [Mycena indigotica]|uniref:Uncharacterized protein n=1 Tax=Mycena indigotica TaxID=2126181 RepID=A0A8H6SV54_9AGAR|nr:uncharacterized protein MIND_00439100 [Mycena indigotica]KAF7306478.1 hypothetical protein MIND_00439100 [Mycena indigotica]